MNVLANTEVLTAASQRAVNNNLYVPADSDTDLWLEV